VINPNNHHANENHVVAGYERIDRCAVAGYLRHFQKIT